MTEVSTENEISQWLDEQDVKIKAESAARKRLERDALKAFNFKDAQFSLKREVYRKAIGA